MSSEESVESVRVRVSPEYGLFRGKHGMRFRTEYGLETWLHAHLSPLLASMGYEVLIFGRQVATDTDGRIDLLGLDARGGIYVIELKVSSAEADVVAQVVDYRGWAEDRNRESLISIAARGRYSIDLEEAFERRFGYSLPGPQDTPPTLIVIAESFTPRAARAILHLDRAGFDAKAFRYSVQDEHLSLVCHRDARGTSISRREPDVSAPRPPRPHLVRHDVVEFWGIFSRASSDQIVLFDDVHEHYRAWFAGWSTPTTEIREFWKLSFGQHLAALLYSSEDWTRVYVRPDARTDPHFGSTVPSMRLRKTDGHRVVAYCRNLTDA
ncbi:hypothetical protein [Microbacterium sp. NPDC056234]|uniref:hypothetical protein n=1 Tax=Microbacterium sp. NPDC056234 TaxID=3345757 RepID=UPI0035D919E9